MVRLKLFAAALAILLLIILAPAGTARAASTSQPASPAAVRSAAGKRPLNGVTISPAFQQITIGQDEDSKDGHIKLTNNTGEPVEFSLSVMDFGSLDETGGVLFIGKDQKSLDYRYGLTSWLTLQQDRIVVDSKATRTVLFTIENKESMAPGGHYGALMITPIQDEQNPAKVDINQVLTSLLFVKKTGGEVYRLGIQDVSVQHRLLSMPGTVSLRFQNSGNVHVVPRGLISVTDPRGHEVKRGIINDGSAIILPQAFRQLKVPLTGLAHAWMPGRYNLRIAYRYDGETSLQYYNTSFYYMNGWYVAAAVLVLAILAGIVLSKRLRAAFMAPFWAAKRWLGGRIQQWRRTR